MSINTPNSSSFSQSALDTATSLAVAAGVKATLVTETWSSLEAEPGTVDVSELQATLNYFHSKGLKCFVGIQVINTVKREVPSDLMSAAFDSPLFITRFHRLLDAIGKVVTGDDVYLSIGNEVDVYLQANPAQWPTYGAFYSDAVSYIHDSLPGMQVGVTATFGGYSGASSAEMQSLNAASDVIILTYYPLSTGEQVSAPGSPLTDFPTMLGLAQGKPVVLQEAGFPSGTLNGSSEATQAQFISDLFAAWQTAGDRMPFLSYFLLYDFDATTCADLDAYYGVANDPAFTSYLCTLGLWRDDGHPKASWNVFTASAH